MAGKMDEPTVVTMVACLVVKSVALLVSYLAGRTAELLVLKLVASLVAPLVGVLVER